MNSQSTCSLLRLQVVAEADPTALSRVLERFQNVNVVPRRVVAESGTNSRIHIQVDLFGMPEEQLGLIAAKIGQAPSVIHARWHRV